MADEIKIIETMDENGNVVKFELYDIVEFEEKEYALLMPVESEDDEIVLMGLEQENDEYLFKVIEDEEEFNRVSEYIESIED
ncbi:DUF1292 domain-containing protein [bacterium]|nr:DUF1292 domain-containing protein [bacterium]